MDTTLERFVPRSVIAGRVPAAKGYPRHESVVADAAKCLDNEALQLTFVEVNGEFFYIASRASDFTGTKGRLANPLAVALPGVPGHQGDGLYVANRATSGMCTAVLVKGGQMEGFAGLRPSIEALAPKYGFNEVIDVSEAAGLGWVGSNALELKEARKTLRFGLTLLFGLSAISAGLAGFSHLAVNAMAPRAAIAERDVVVATQQLREAARILKTPSDLAPLDLQRQLEGLVSTYRADGATLRFFRHDAKGTAYEVLLPDYVLPGAYSGLRDVSATRVERQIVLTRKPQALGLPGYPGQPANSQPGQGEPAR